MEVYEFIKSIGQGMFGQVFLVKHKVENKQYAIKRINFQDINQKERDNLENEVLLLQDLRHPNIVQYKDSFSDKDDNYNIVMVYCDGGDIYSKIKNAKGKHFPENEILEWIVQLGLALSYIHDKKILHRDMKTQNIFLQNGKIRIGDFGIAKMFNQTKDMAGSIVGTPLYMSPEQYNGKKYGFKSDIWSLGCCLFEMCNLKHAFEGKCWNAVIVKVIKNQRAPLNSSYSKELRGLIDQMLNLNPKSRPTVAGILEKPFMKPKVAAYIHDFIQNYQKYDGDEFQMEILKEQAEKFGIFNRMLKDIDGIESSDNLPTSKNNLKDLDDLNNITEIEKKSLFDQRKKCEGMIAEFEKQRKTELEQISYKNKVKRAEIKEHKPLTKEKSQKSYSIEKSHYNNIASNSIEKGKQIQRKYGTNENNNKRDDSLSKKVRQNSEEANDHNNNIMQFNQDKNKSKFNRPLTGKRDDGNQSFNREDNSLGERSKINKLNQEISKYKNYIEQIDLKLQKYNTTNNNNTNEILECDEVDNNSDENPNSPSMKNKGEKEPETDIQPIETDKQKKLGERIKFFRTRCESSLGKKLFIKAYDYLKANRSAEPSDAREHLTNLFGKDNIGFWQLIEQILILEDIMTSN